MANTRDTIGEQATLDGLVARTLTSFEEDGVTDIKANALYGFDCLTDVKMPNLKSCGEYAFSGTGLIEITADAFPSLNVCSDSCFSKCDNLINAEFSALTRVSQMAFSHCYKLKSFKSYNTSSLQIDANAFSMCNALQEIIILSSSVATLSNGSFSLTPFATKCGVVYVPRILVDSYKTANNWKYYFIAPYEDYPVLPDGTITDTWTEILAAEEDGTYLEKYNIGDTKYEKLGDTFVNFEIVAFDKDDLADGSGKAHITWLAKHFLYSTRIKP